MDFGFGEFGDWWPSAGGFAFGASGWTVAVVAFSLALLLLLPLALRRKRIAVDELETRQAGYSVGDLKRFGVAVLLAFFVGLGGWSALAPLASATIAPGVVSPEGNVRTVQHLEGGIIQAIHVRDGDEVAVGDPLITLRDTQAGAAHAVLVDQRRALLAAEARLMAEQRRADRVTVPAELADSDDPAVQALVALERDSFAAKLAAREGQEDILRQRIAQLEEEIAGLEAQIVSQTTQLDLIEEEIVGVRAMVDKGLERRPRLLALERARADIEGERADSRARIARARQAIGETEVRILTMAEQFRDEINAELTQTRNRLATINSEMLATQDVLARTIIAAPLAGTVVNLNYTTTGGVIGPGQPILDIVPEEEELLVDARVSPIDIDDVGVGQEARIVLSAYKQRNLPRLFGKVRYISADRLTDEVTGQPYFRAQIAVDEEQLATLGEGVVMTPGMPAEVLIQTGQQTVFDYLLNPFLDVVRRSFREA